MKLNKEKLDQMVEAVMNATHSPKELEDKYEFNYQILNTRLRIRTALTPFCMEMTDEEIFEAKEKYCRGISIAESVGEIGDAYIDALKCIRDAK